MDIYLIRHGETDWNRMKKLQGTTDIPLNAYGIELAEKTAEGLKAGCTVIDMSSINPVESQNIAKKLAEYGIELLFFLQPLLI